jgi:hypothetical protein
VLNALHDGLKVSGSAAESYWQLANPTWHANWAADAELGATAAEEEDAYEDLEEDMMLALHKARRLLMTRGVDMEALGGGSPDPRGPFSVFMQLVAAGSGIPQRVLFGSERGELASSQDWELFIDQVDDRRLQFAEPVVVRPFYDRLIEAGALKGPGGEGRYALDWPDLRTRSEKGEAEVAVAIADAMSKMADARLQGAPFTDAELREALNYPAENEELEADRAFAAEEAAAAVAADA